MKTVQGAHNAYMQAKTELRIATAELEDALFDEHLRGKSQRELARDVGMHHQTVAYLVNHAKARYAAAKEANHGV